MATNYRDLMLNPDGSLREYRPEIYLRTFVVLLSALVLSNYLVIIGEYIGAVWAFALSVYFINQFRHLGKIWEHGYRAGVRAQHRNEDGGE